MNKFYTEYFRSPKEQRLGQYYKLYSVSRRDSQKNKLYKAERDAFATVPDSFGQLRYVQDLPAADVPKFVRAVVRSKKWKSLHRQFHRNAMPEVLSRFTSGRRFSRGNIGRITINRDYHLCKLIVLHELAHGIVPHAGHNWPFAYAFHALVSRFLGAEAARKLKQAFRANRVRCTPPRILTASQREKLRERGRQLQQRRLSLTQQPISAESKETL